MLLSTLSGLRQLLCFEPFTGSTQRARLQALITGIKRGDTVVLSNGMIGKVARVEDTEVGVEIATGVTVKVVKAMISDVRTRGEPAAANDTKS